MKSFLSVVLSLTVLLTANLSALELHVVGDKGTDVVLDVHSTTTVGELKEEIESIAEDDDGCSCCDESYVLSFDGSPDQQALDDSDDLSKAHHRNYYRGYTVQEKNDLTYIVSILANKPLISILRYKKSLEAAGDRIDSLHPLRFLEIVFTDHELATGVRAIRHRGWVWKDFYNGITGSLTEEFNRGNLTDEMVTDFASKVDVPLGLIMGCAMEAYWKQFIEALIYNAPCGSHGDDYDM